SCPAPAAPVPGPWGGSREGPGPPMGLPGTGATPPASRFRRTKPDPGRGKIMVDVKRVTGPTPGMENAANPGPKSEMPREAEPFRQNFITTKLDYFINWGRKNALWPMPFGTACCAIEFISVVSSHYHLSRFGAPVLP